jgi:hypothetical protein
MYQHIFTLVEGVVSATVLYGGKSTVRDITAEAVPRSCSGYISGCKV